MSRKGYTAVEALVVFVLGTGLLAILILFFSLIRFLWQ